MDVGTANKIDFDEVLDAISQAAEEWHVDARNRADLPGTHQPGRDGIQPEYNGFYRRIDAATPRQDSG